MGRTLTLDIPEDVYQSLMQKAEQTGQQPEVVAVQLLATATQYHVVDPLDQFIGTFSSHGADWADHHDAYLGVAARDTMRNRAATIYRRARQQGYTFITTNYILTEVAALLISPLRIPRSKIIAFITGLKTSPHVKIVHVDPTLDAQAWQLFTERLDKEWSLVDCASFVVMQQRGLREASTTDHHFEQAGFVCLLKA